MNQINRHIAAEDEAGLSVSLLTQDAEVQALRDEWLALEELDEETTIFLSWEWLSRAFEQNPGRWGLLVVRDRGAGDVCVGLLPLKYSTRWSKSSGRFQTQISAGGRLLFSEYTGFLCAPTYERAVVNACAQALDQLAWRGISLRYLFQKERTADFEQAMTRLGYQVERRPYRINNGETDNLVAPQVGLPDDFETYLMERISRNTRQRYRRFQRTHFASGEYRFTHTDADTLDRDMDILMSFWRAKWQEDKGARTAAKVASNFENMLRTAHEVNGLFVPILWRGDQPLGALGHVMDPRVGTMHFIIAGRDVSADEPFIGPALHFHSIECAIMLGCISYDFGHGDEPYKFSYGTEAEKLDYLTIRRGRATRSMSFDSRFAGMALAKLEGMISADSIEDAKKACRQLARAIDRDTIFR